MRMFPLLDNTSALKSLHASGVDLLEFINIHPHLGTVRYKTRKAIAQVDNIPFQNMNTIHTYGRIPQQGRAFGKSLLHG